MRRQKRRKARASGAQADFELDEERLCNRPLRIESLDTAPCAASARSTCTCRHIRHPRPRRRQRLPRFYPRIRDRHSGRQESAKNRLSGSWASTSVLGLLQRARRLRRAPAQTPLREPFRNRKPPAPLPLAWDCDARALGRWARSGVLSSGRSSLLESATARTTLTRERGCEGHRGARCD